MFRRKLNVFVLYSHEDAQLVAPIVRLLAAMRNDVFMDSESIEPGSVWRDSINEAIRKADVIVVFWCRHSNESTWVRKECQLGVLLNRRIMPLLLDDTKLSAGLDSDRRSDASDVSQ